MTIPWNDGHVSEYTFGWLREACPCAECRGGHENMGTIPTRGTPPGLDDDLLMIPLMDARATQLQDVQMMGNYAINLIWMDGHKHGIYNWGYLRAICGCAECLEKRD